MHRKAVSLLLVSVSVLFLMACSSPAPSATPTTIRLSMIPTTDPGKMARDGEPLIKYLERELNAKIEMTVPTNYAAVVEAVANDQVDIAHLGGFTYVQASQRSGAVPLVQRDRDQNFHSYFITQPDSGINSLNDLKGRTFAFGDVNSTSGRLMPQYYLREAGMDAEVLPRAIFTGAHDATALAVANKKVDAGALDESVFDRMLQEGKLDAGQVKIFYTTPAFVDYTWVARKGLDGSLTKKFSDAFVNLKQSDPEQKQILDFLTADRYVVAQDANWERLRQAARDAELLK
jgi:phosphonate transport system substrate-binding protein